MPDTNYEIERRFTAKGQPESLFRVDHGWNIKVGELTGNDVEGWHFVANGVNFTAESVKSGLRQFTQEYAAHYKEMERQQAARERRHDY